MGQSCDVGPYRATRARVAQAGPTRLAFAGDDPVVIRIDGDGGAPDVALTGPGGFRITTEMYGYQPARFIVATLSDPVWAAEVTA